MNDHLNDISAENPASIFDAFNEVFNVQKKAIGELYKLWASSAEEGSKERLKLEEKTNELIFTSTRKASEKEKNARKAAVQEFLNDKVEAHIKALEEIGDLDEAQIEEQRKKLTEYYKYAADEAGKQAALRARIAEAEEKQKSDSGTKAIDILMKAKTAQLEKELEITESYEKKKESVQQKALDDYCAKKRVSLNELSEEQIEKILEEAEARIGTLEDYKKEQEELAKKEEKNKRPIAFDDDPDKPKSVAFKEAWDDTKERLGEGFKKTKEKYIKTDPETGRTDISGAFNALAGFVQSLSGKMAEAGKPQAKVDTRLYGSTANGKSILGSYWQDLSGDIMSIAGASPLMLQTDMIASLTKLVDTGISHNLKLRAFLDTAKDKIATTFEVADAAILRLVRIQQQDTTAARLGMESALNAFLNNMFETTEYLSSLADSVRGNLVEAQSLMGAKDATEFEYQVQKWMGSMYSVGMSDNAVTNISTTIGQLAAGQIEALTGSATGNLMIMAANEAGLSIADILKDGLNADTTNKLLQATVNYLAKIAQQSDSKVIQQQLAGVFGMQASDLKAVTNLVVDNGKTVKNIAKNSVTNTGMITELITRAATMTMRTSTAEMMNNMWENVQYSMASGIANNPATYALFKMSGLLEEATGGINLPFLNVYGFGVDLETSVAKLMQVGALAGGIMTSLPQMIGGLANAAAGGTGMLLTAGLLTQGSNIRRGSGAVGAANLLAQSGLSSSSSGLVGNASSDDMTGATMSGGQDDKDSLGGAAKEENEDATRDDIIDILKMLFGIIGDKIDATTAAIKGQGGLFNDNSTTMGGFTNASVSKTSAI